MCSLPVVSIKEPKLYKPPTSVARKHPSGRTIRVLCVDVGMKYNQLRCFLKRGVEVLVCPWDHDIVAAAGDEFGITRYREITKSGYRAGYLVNEARREAVVLAIFRDGQDIRELLS